MTKIHTEEHNGSEIHVAENADGSFEVSSIDFLRFDVFDGQIFESVDGALDEAAAFVDSICCNADGLFDSFADLATYGGLGV